MGEAYPIPAPNAEPRQRHHYDLYKTALRRCWLQKLCDACPDERSAFIAHALHWLADLIDIADPFLERVHAGEPIRLGKAEMLDQTGIPDRTVHRYRTFLQQHELLTVHAGSWNDGQPYAAHYYVHLDTIAAPELERRAQERAKRRATVGEPARERAARLSAEADELAQDAAAHEQQSDPSPNRPGMPQGLDRTSVDNRPRAQSNARANAGRSRLPSGQGIRSQSRQSIQSPAYDPSDPADLTLAAPVIAAYTDHPTCHPLRRHARGAAAIVCAGDAQVVRLIASLARDAMPVQLLVDAVSAECAAHSPGPDERSSPWIDYFARFRSTVARAATAWKHPAVAAANDRKRQLCDLLRSLPGPRFGGNPDSRSLARELHAAGLAEPVLNSHELTTTLLDWFGGWWDGNTPDDNERMVMSALKA